MEITVAKIADVVTLRLLGKLDATVADALKKKFSTQGNRRARSAHHHRRVRVPLSAHRVVRARLFVVQ